MANTNCLVGFECPKCGQKDRFKVVMSAVFDLTDDGTGDPEDTEWDGSSLCECPECGHEATVAEFCPSEYGPKTT